ncbi:MAG: hypothetical protein ACOC5G_04105 [Acidobacteriota bacterium]
MSKIEIKYSNRHSVTREPATWKGSVEAAKRIALAEIHEHAGGDSAAYEFTKAVFDYYERNCK